MKKTMYRTNKLGRNTIMTTTVWTKLQLHLPYKYCIYSVNISAQNANLLAQASWVLCVYLQTSLRWSVLKLSHVLSTLYQLKHTDTVI